MSKVQLQRSERGTYVESMEQYCLKYNLITGAYKGVLQNGHWSRSDCKFIECTNYYLHIPFFSLQTGLTWARLSEAKWFRPVSRHLESRFRIM